MISFSLQEKVNGNKITGTSSRRFVFIDRIDATKIKKKKHGSLALKQLYHYYFFHFRTIPKNSSIELKGLILSPLIKTARKGFL